MGLFDLFKVDRRLRALEEDFLTLKRTVTSAALDWDNLYDKCRTLMGRVSKDRARMEASKEAETEGASPVEAGDGSNGAPHGLLTNRQKKIQQQILQRRGGM